ncbi:hypothetical protein T4E_7203 [Trichinella pseudospiralis]|uniref:Uncharacterized protein n=1 Tax=Trichinella pseudospiralis TaxID=6337 RepID=A0A0V0YMB1_TRIPS|nr:hypothetical protein T4E_7203 [Trichinella pseudospiralis]
MQFQQTALHNKHSSFHHLHQYHYNQCHALEQSITANKDALNGSYFTFDNKQEKQYHTFSVIAFLYPICNLKTAIKIAYHIRRPLRPPFRRVLSDGIGVTSSIRPIFIPERAKARRADCAPGPGVFVFVPPVALNFICSAVIPSALQRSAASCAANMAAYGEASSLSALTFIPPVTRHIVSRPVQKFNIPYN